MKGFKKGCLLTLVTVVGLLALSFYVLASNLGVIVVSPLGHTLEPISIFDWGNIAIKDTEGHILFSKVIHFQVEGNNIYGDSAHPEHDYFLIRLDTNAVNVFPSHELLELKLASLGLRNFSFKDQITYWDIRKAGKKSVAEYLASNGKK